MRMRFRGAGLCMLAAGLASAVLVAALPNGRHCISLAHQISEAAAVEVFRVSPERSLSYFGTANPEVTHARHLIYAKGRVLTREEEYGLRREVVHALVASAIIPPSLFTGTRKFVDNCPDPAAMSIVFRGNGEQPIEALVNFDRHTVEINGLVMTRFPFRSMAKRSEILFSGNQTMKSGVPGSCS